MAKSKYDRIYKLIATVAVSTVMAQAFYLIFYWLLFDLVLVTWLFLIMFCAVGYGLQAIYGRITGRRNDPRAGYHDETGYEGAAVHFKPLRAAGPLTAAALLAIFSHSFFDKLYYMLAENMPHIIYTNDSVYPYIFMISMFVGMGAGAVMWFYPAHRLISLRTMTTYIIIMWLMFLIAVVMGVPTGLMTVYLIVFAVCAFIVLNQTHIQRGVTDTLTAISGRGRLYNAKLVVVVLASISAFLLLMASVLTGLKYVARFIMVLLFVGSGETSSGDEYGYYDADEIIAQHSNVFLNNKPVGEKLLFILFIIFFICGIAFLLSRGTDLTKRLIDMIKTWLRELFLFFMDAKGYKTGRERTEYEFANYRDEEIRLNNAVIHEYEMAAEKTNSYREFVSRLNALPTSSEQIRFAYITLMKLYRSRGFGNKLSETPREAKRKIVAKTADRCLDRVTDGVEMIDYAELSIPEGESREIITSMCGIIEKHYDA